MKNTSPSSPLQKLPESENSAAVRAYVGAQQAKSFADHADFFHPEVHFNGLVLNAKGAERIASEMDKFLPAVASLEVEAAAEVQSGPVGRFLVLYRFQMQGQEAAQALCDHIRVEKGRIRQVDNVFDVTQLPVPAN